MMTWKVTLPSADAATVAHARKVVERRGGTLTERAGEWILEAPSELAVFVAHQSGAIKTCEPIP